MPKKEEFILENLGKLSKEEIVKQQEKEAHAEWVKDFKKRKKTEEDERAENLESLGKRDKGAAAKGRAFRQEMEFEKTVSGKIKEAEEEERVRDIKKMREKIVPKEGTKKLRKKEVPVVVGEKFDFSDLDAEKMEKQKLRRELAEKEEEVLEVEPEQIIEKKSAEEEYYGTKNDAEIYRHLRANLSDYPQFITPEIKINLKTVQKQKGVIEKYQDVLEKNKDNAKKKAQNKIKEARQKIKDAKEAQKRAQDVIDDHLRDIIKQYNSSGALLSQLSEDLNGDGKKQGLVDKINGTYEKGMGKGKPYKIEKHGALSGLKKFFQDKKLKKKLGEDGWEKFEQLKLDYLVKDDAYRNRLSVHTKKYGELDKLFNT